MVKICLQCRSPGFDPWVRKIPWRRAGQPTPVFLPGESHGQRSLVGYSPWGFKESDTTQRLTFSFKILKQFGRSPLLVRRASSIWNSIWLRNSSAGDGAADQMGQQLSQTQGPRWVSCSAGTWPNPETLSAEPLSFHPKLSLPT